MTSQMVYAARLAFFGLIGLLVGVGHLASLHENVRLYMGGRSRSAAGVHLARLALAVGAWLAIARFGHAAGLLGGFIGFLISRPLVTTWLGRTRS